MLKSSFIIYVIEVVAIPMEMLVLHCKDNEHGKVLRVITVGQKHFSLSLSILIY